MSLFEKNLEICARNLQVYRVITFSTERGIVMARNVKSYANVWVLVLLLLVGGLTGSAIGNALSPALPWLKSNTIIGLKPTTIDLDFFNLTFGFTFLLSPLTALGLIAGYFIYRRF